VRNLLSSAYVRAALVLAAVLALDQASKRIVAHEIALGEQVKLLPGVQLVHTRNHGVAFGLAAGDRALVAVLVAIALIALVVYFVQLPLGWPPFNLADVSIVAGVVLLLLSVESGERRSR
jgi:signal peptidase II